MKWEQVEIFKCICFNLYFIKHVFFPSTYSNTAIAKISCHVKKKTVEHLVNLCEGFCAVKRDMRPETCISHGRTSGEEFGVLTVPIRQQCCMKQDQRQWNRKGNSCKSYQVILMFFSINRASKTEKAPVYTSTLIINYQNENIFPLNK